MRIADWNDYELIDTGSGERLERWGDILLIRPDPQIIWKSDKKDPRWKNAHARYRRSNTGGGRWEAYKKLPDVWKITRGPLVFRLKPMAPPSILASSSVEASSSRSSITVLTEFPSISFLIR